MKGVGPAGIGRNSVVRAPARSVVWPGPIMTTSPNIKPSRAPLSIRHTRILELLNERGSLLVSDAAEMLRVSGMTIRRDFLELENSGHLVRVHGGAVPPSVAATRETDDLEPDFDWRLRQHNEAKRRIAVAAAGLVAGLKAIAIDVGTSTLLLAQQLAPVANLTIFTNSVRVASELSAPNREVYLAGGKVRPGELAISGPGAAAQFTDYWFDAAVLGASSISTLGIFDYSLEDIEMKRIYVRRATEKIVLCDSSKFLQQSLIRICPLDEITTLVTDAPPPAELAGALAAARVKVVIA